MCLKMKNIELLECPRCGSSADMYQVDLNPPSWRISCNQHWKVCNFQVDSTDEYSLPFMWNMIPRRREHRREALLKIIEIHGGIMDGRIPETELEIYQKKLIDQMYMAAVNGLAVGNAQQKLVPCGT